MCSAPYAIYFHRWFCQFTAYAVFPPLTVPGNLHPEFSSSLKQKRS